MSTTKLHKTPEEEFASKKKKMHPRPVVEGEETHSTQKMKTDNKSANKSKLTSNNKAPEFTRVEEERTTRTEENLNTFATTPLKTTPNKNGLKSCKEREKTPYASKVKDASDIESNPEDTSLLREEGNPTPSRASRNLEKTAERNAHETRSKSPLGRIEEARNESEKKANPIEEERKEETVEVDMHAPTETRVEEVPVENLVENPVSEIATETHQPPTTEIFPENGNEGSATLEVRVEEELAPVNNVENGEVSLHEEVVEEIIQPTEEKIDN